VAGAIVACALGMGTKETMIGAPLVAAAWLWLCWPDETLTGRPRALLIGLGATMVIAIGLAIGGARSGSAGFGAGGWTSMGYLQTQAGVIVHYIRLAFWPNPLVFQYSWLPAESWRAVMPQAILLVTLAAATVTALVRRWPIALAGLWFFVILAPSSSIIPISTEVAAEHRMYLPLVAVIAVVVLSLRYLARLAGSVGASFIDRAGTAALILVVLMLALTTIDRNRAYASAETMAADTVRNRPRSANAQLVYGTVLVDQKRFAEAETHLREAAVLPIPPSTDASKMRSLAHFYLGLALVAQQKHDEGSQELEKVLSMRADFDRAYRPLAEAQLTLRRTPDAVRTLERAITRQPDDPVLRRRIAWILATSSNDAARNGRRAIEHAERAVALTDSRDPLAFDVLAAACAEAGQFDAALTALASAVNIIRASGQTDLIGMLRSHLALFEAKRPIRSADW
jgi:tetratricopeptide (TPR) repeat protein